MTRIIFKGKEVNSIELHRSGDYYYLRVVTEEQEVFETNQFRLKFFKKGE